MKIGHSILCFLTIVYYGFVYAVGEIPTGRGVKHEVEDVVGGNVAQAADLVSVSLAPQSLLCLREQAARPRNAHV